MIDKCHSPSLLPVDEALKKIVELVKKDARAGKAESVELHCAVNRILAEDVVADLDIPPCDNSAMDGYAIIAADLKTTNRLVLAGTAFAGKPFEGTVISGQCVRIMTGATIPDGADAVIMQEEVRATDTNVEFLCAPESGENIRRQGASITKGSTILKRGERLDAARIALVASQGKNTVKVFSSLTVGVLATGEELALPGEPLKHGHIYESNRVMVSALLQQFGATVIDYGIVPDDFELTRLAIEKANHECDVIITSGGVSVGDADFVRDVISQLGSVDFWKVAIKPGKPFAFGKLNDAWFCGLPGNPVSSYVTCQQLVIPFLAALQQETFQSPETINAIAAAPLKKQPGRKDFQRGLYHRTPDGDYLAKANGPQGSNIMTSVTNANCYIVLEKEQGNVAEGERIKIIPFNQLVT